MSDATMHYSAREIVGVFPTSEALEAAVDQLEIAGVNRAAISVLGIDRQRPASIDTVFQSAKAISDDPVARHAAFVSQPARVEGESLAITFPFLVGGMAAAWAVAAAGGALLLAIGATVVGGGVAAGLGTLLYRAVSQKHAANIAAQLSTGGLVLWVSTPDAAAEARALQVLRNCGGQSVHAHTIDQHWGVEDTPLHGVQPDPFLESDRGVRHDDAA
jgi:hypothetical protein